MEDRVIEREFKFTKEWSKRNHDHAVITFFAFVTQEGRMASLIIFSQVLGDLLDCNQAIQVFNAKAHVPNFTKQNNDERERSSWRSNLKFKGTSDPKILNTTLVLQFDWMNIVSKATKPEPDPLKSFRP